MNVLDAVRGVLTDSHQFPYCRTLTDRLVAEGLSKPASMKSHAIANTLPAVDITRQTDRSRFRQVSVHVLSLEDSVPAATGEGTWRQLK